MTQNYKIRIETHITPTRVMSHWLDQTPKMVHLVVSALCPVCRRRAFLSWDKVALEWWGYSACGTTFSVSREIVDDAPIPQGATKEDVYRGYFFKPWKQEK